jgi:hypothetical protein
VLVIFASSARMGLQEVFLKHHNLLAQFQVMIAQPPVPAKVHTKKERLELKKNPQTCCVCKIKMKEKYLLEKNKRQLEKQGLLNRSRLGSCPQCASRMGVLVLPSMWPPEVLA